jgi:hypothetical protein
VLDPNTLLLFEVLDNRTSLNMKQRSSALKKPPKRVAWGYLVPVGTTGNIHVGIPEDFKQKADESADKPLKSDRGGRRTRRPRQRGGQDDEGEEEEAEDNDDKPAVEKGGGMSINKMAHEADIGAFDITRRLQLYAYQGYDGIVGSIQRAMMGWSEVVDDTPAAVAG